MKKSIIAASLLMFACTKPSWEDKRTEIESEIRTQIGEDVPSAMADAYIACIVPLVVATAQVNECTVPEQHPTAAFLTCMKDKQSMTGFAFSVEECRILARRIAE